MNVLSLFIQTNILALSFVLEKRVELLTTVRLAIQDLVTLNDDRGDCGDTYWLLCRRALGKWLLCGVVIMAILLLGMYGLWG